MREAYLPGVRALARRLAAGLMLVLGIAVLGGGAEARDSERRLALVIANQKFDHVRPLRTAANDAGLIAQTLQAAGFEVIGARDLDAQSLRDTFSEFLDQLNEAGPGAVAFVYLAGYGVQSSGENYMLPTDAHIRRGADVPQQAVRLSDYMRPLAALPLSRRIVVLDLAHGTPFRNFERPLAPGLALVDAVPGMLVAFNAAPDTVAPQGEGPYGAYAQALAEMLRLGDLDPQATFHRVRLRVNDVTDGAFLPWHSEPAEHRDGDRDRDGDRNRDGDRPRGRDDFVFFERTADAPPPRIARNAWHRRHARQMRDFEPDEAYLEAIDRDSLPAYLEFLETFPDHPLARRVRAIVAARREAMIWRRLVVADSPEAYWTYLDRYPDGPHAWDARRRLRQQDTSAEPPSSYSRTDTDDIPPPSRDEVAFIGRHRGLIFEPREFEEARAPHAPASMLPPRSQAVWGLGAPTDTDEAFVLPIPAFVPLPRHLETPRHVAPPPNNAVFGNIHGGEGGHEHGPRDGGDRDRGRLEAGVGIAAAIALGAAALKVALPPSVARKQGGVVRTQAPDAGPGGAPQPQNAPPPGASPPAAGQPEPGHPGHRQHESAPAVAPAPAAVPPTRPGPAAAAPPAAAPAAPQPHIAAPAPAPVQPESHFGVRQGAPTGFQGLNAPAAPPPAAPTAPVAPTAPPAPAAPAAAAVPRVAPPAPAAPAAVAAPHVAPPAPAAPAAVAAPHVAPPAPAAPAAVAVPHVAPPAPAAPAAVAVPHVAPPAPAAPAAVAAPRVAPPAPAAPAAAGAPAAAAPAHAPGPPGAGQHQKKDCGVPGKPDCPPPKP